VLFEPVEIADVILLTRNLELLCHSQILSLYSGYWKQLFIQAKKHGDVPDMMTLKPKDDIVLQVQKIDLTQLVSESPEQIKMYLEFAYDQSKQVDKHNARYLSVFQFVFVDSSCIFLATCSNSPNILWTLLCKPGAARLWRLTWMGAL